MKLIGSGIIIIVGLYCFFIVACNNRGSKQNSNPETAKKNKKMSKSYNPAVYFEIPVTDIDRAIKFYNSVFGFEFERDVVHNNEMAFFPLNDENTGISGALAKGEIYKPTKDGTLLYLNTDNIERTLELAIQNGGEILFPITVNGDWGSVAEFKDCEGNRIALRQSVK